MSEWAGERDGNACEMWAKDRSHTRTSDVVSFDVSNTHGGRFSSPR